MQALVRGWQCARRVQELRLRNAAATVVQAAWRSFWVRQSFLTLRAAVVILQMSVRRWQVRGGLLNPKS